MPRRRQEGGPVVLADDPLWYKDAVIYELHVKAFADSNGDGIGDLPGLTGTLDYLQDLGVTTLWLLPFYPSPLRDDGYDIADYTAVHPHYGTLADFKTFLREAHRRGLRVITELVLNHTSDQHPWFQRARRAKAGSPERDFYVWSDTPDKYLGARVIFKDFEPSNWTWDPVAKSYFWHRFYAHQPDLNYDNPAVHEAALAALDFWLNLGVDGLRLDAVPYLYEREGTNCENLEETHAFLKSLRRHIDEKYPNVMLLAEANQWPEDSVAYFGAGDECHMAFHFPVMPRLFMAIHREDRFPITDILQQTPAIPDACQWALFLRNHDELTLEMVTDEDRDYMWRTYARDPQARINLGIRRRLAPLLENHRPRIELMNGLLFSLPGTPVLYYGDEIGMGDNIYLGDRNGVRTPMQWNGSRNAGFSLANPQRLYLPVVIDPAYHYEAVNVEAEQNNQHSLLWWTKRLIALRKRHRAFGRGSLQFLSAENAKVLAFVRRYEDETLLVVANLSRFVEHAELDLSAFQGLVPVEIRGRTRFPAVGAAPYFLTLGGHDFYWFDLEKPAAATGQGTALPRIEVKGRWDAVFQGTSLQALEAALPAHLRRSPWFHLNGHDVEEARLLDVVPLPAEPAPFQAVLLEVAFDEGDPRVCFVPMAFAAREPKGLEANTAVAHLALGPTGEGTLFDALGDEAYVRALAATTLGKRRHRGKFGNLGPTAFASDLALPDGPIVARKSDRRHTSFIFGDRLLFRVFRRPEEGPRPEVEIGRFLRERTSFANVLRPLAALDYRRGTEEPQTLAVVHEWLPHATDGWQHMIDALSRSFEQALTTREAPVLPAKSGAAGAAPPSLSACVETARLLGQRAAEMHVALATDQADPAFAPEAFTSHYQRSLYQSLRARARQALAVLRRRLKELPDETRAAAALLLSAEDELLRRPRNVFERVIVARRTRCHGDFQLTHVLHTGKDVVVIDFGGPTGQSLVDRRRKRSPLEDVAAMLLSFHRAALTALHHGNVRPEDTAFLRPWAEAARQWASSTFLQAYWEAAGTADFLPADRGQRDVLLDFCLIDEAATELGIALAGGAEALGILLQVMLDLLGI